MTKKNLDFSNTEVAFSNKSDAQLMHTLRLFRLMSNQTLVNSMSGLGLLAVRWKLPFAKMAIRKTIFEQFVGGENLMDAQAAIEHLYKFGALTILDYGAEGKTTEEELNLTMKETIKAVELAASNNSVPAVSTKLTGLADNALLEKLNTREKLSQKEQKDYDKLIFRINEICSRAESLGVSVLIDAEESWMQIAIDEIVMQMMYRYNTDKVVVYNTYQIYRHDKLEQMINDHKLCKSKGVMLGSKIVRGAYMEKERERAIEEKYTSPIHLNKEAVDKDYNLAIKYCVEHYETIGSICATHNIESNLYQAQLIEEKGIPKNHPHLNFCQLYGMSDYITFNLADSGYNVAKYVPYGPIEEVVPYLIRRAKENSSVTGEMGRELKYISKEKKRRGL